MLAIMMNGDLVKPEDAQISVLDHGFLFGDSIYEVVRLKKGVLFGPRHHFKRLRYSAKNIGLVIPWDNEFLLEELERMANYLGLQEASLRLMITRGVGPLTLDPEQCENPTRILFGKESSLPSPDMYEKGVSVAVSDIRKSPASLEKGNLKTGNYLDHVLALKTAKQHGCHEALLLNHVGEVAECTTSNIFWFKDGILYTPSLGSGVLKGMTRQLTMELARRDSITVVEGRFPIDQLLDADEVFITSTSREILPVSRIGESEYGVGASTRALMGAFHTLDVNLLDF